MIALAIIASAALGAAAALVLRRWLRALSLTVWFGWMLIGAGLPVLAGQLAALLLAETAANRSEACASGMDAACASASLLIMVPLTLGLCAGLGWAAGAISARLGSQPDPS